MTTLTATAADDVGVARVEFFADGSTTLGSATAQPWTATFDAALLSDGMHVLTARATDGAGNATTSDGVSIVVGAGPADLSAPAVQILTPAPDETTPLVVAISVQATDDVGVTSVQLELDGSVVETLTTAPWTKSLEVSAGAHSLVAIAADASGKTTRSNAVAFSASGDVEPPGPVQPEKVIGGCGCSSADATPFHLAFMLLAFALRARRR
jgi:uncharacterized protein (TIGR03382 family)